MRRRSTEQNDGSLDLLLDTICNTFGGILLIALLVIVLLNTTAKTTTNATPSPPSQVELVETAIVQEQLQAEITRLQDALKESEQTRGTLVTPTVIQKARDLKTLTNAKTQALLNKSRTLDAIAKVQAEINTVSQQKDDAAKAAERNAAIKSEMKTEVSERSRTAVIPKVERSALSSRAFFLRDGKIYGPVYDGVGFNTKDVRKIKRGKQTYLEPNPQGGLAVAKTNPYLEGLERKFAGISPDRFNVKIYVWPDSFDRYGTVRDVLINKSLKIELVPMIKDGFIVVSSSAGGPSMVQ